MAEKRPTPPVIARTALERVLARAAELQAGGDDEGGGLTEEQLVELAGEVGLSRENVRVALAEERARIDLAPETGIAQRLLGTATVQAARTTPGDATATLAALDAWMQGHESLQVMRRFVGQMAWEPRRDFVSAVRRALRVGGRGFHLTHVSEVRGIVAPVEGKGTHTRLVASFAGERARRATIALGVAAAGVMVGVPAFWLAADAGLALASALSVVPALVVPALAISIARRGYAALVARGQVALEQALDRLEYGDGRPRGK